MKKKFYIRDFIQTNEDGLPLYYMGYYTGGSWTAVTVAARCYDTEQEAFWKIEELVKEGGEYEIVTTYSN